MAVIQNTFDGGVDAGDITTANSGGSSGTAFNNVTISNTSLCTVAYSATNLHGGLSALVNGNGASGFMEWTGLTTKTLAVRFYVRFNAWPSTDTQIFTPRNSTNYVGGLIVRTTGTLRFTASQWAGGGALHTTAALTLNTWYRVEMSWNIGTTTSNSTAKFAYYVGDSTTAVATYDSGATLDCGTTNVISMRAGKLNSSGTLGVFIDSWGYDPATTTYLGKFTPTNIAPVAEAGLSQTGVVPGTAVTLDGSDSYDADGTIVSWNWVQTAGTTVALSGEGDSRTFLAPSVSGGTNLTFELTVTDDDGATGTDTVDVSVLSPGGTANQVQNTFNGGTAGTAITLANSGGASGTAFDYIEVGAGATLNYVSSPVMHGARAAMFSGNTLKAFTEWSVGPTKKLTARFHFRYATLPTAANNVVVARAASAQAASIIWNTNGKLRVCNTTGSSVHDSPTLTANTWYRFEIAWEIGTTTSNSKVWFSLFEGDSTTALDTFSDTAQNLGLEAIALLRFGKIDTAGNNTFYFDSVTYDPTSTTLLGPHSALNIAPVASAGTGQSDIEPGTIVTITGSASTDPDGTIASWSWAQTAGTTVTLSGSGHTRTFKAPYTLNGAVLGFTLTVTDNLGATATAGVAISVFPALERAIIEGVQVPIEPKAVIGGVEV